MGKQSKAYAEGYAAYPDGTNPYESETSNYTDWNDGLAAARHDEQTTQTDDDDDVEEELDEEVWDDEEDEDEEGFDE